MLKRDLTEAELLYICIKRIWTRDYCKTDELEHSNDIRSSRKVGKTLNEAGERSEEWYMLFAKLEELNGGTSRLLV